MQNAKALISSNTFQLAVAQAIGGGIMVFATAYPQLGWLAIAKSLVDVFLRLKTTQPIGSIT